MPAPSSQHQWYLARDGQQYGPLSDPELAKFVELGHLQPTDLLWREGFPDWRPALVVFPPSAGGGAGPAGRKDAAAAPVAGAKPFATPAMEAMRPGVDAVDTGKRPSPLADSDDDLEPRRRFSIGRWFKRLFFIAIVLTGAWFAYLWRADLGRVIGALGTTSSSSVNVALPPENRS